MKKRVSIAAILIILIAFVLSLRGTADDITTPNVPIPNLPPDTYFGVEGGLYQDQSNMPPIALKARLESASQALQQDDKIVLLCVGMSNLKHTCDKFIDLAAASSQMSSSVSIHNGGRPGRAQQAYDGATPNDLYTDLSRAGTSPSEIDVVMYFNAWAYPSGSFESHRNEMRLSLLETYNNLNAAYSSLDLVYVTSREYAPAWAQALNPNPYAYQEGFAYKDLIQAFVNGDIAGAPVAWGAYQYNPSWPDNYFRPGDGVHLSDEGLAVVAQLWLDFFLTQDWFKSDGHPTVTPTSQETPTPAATVCAPWAVGCVGPTVTPRARAFLPSVRSDK